MKSKKFGLLAVLLALLMCLACVFAACDNNEETPPENPGTGDTPGDGDDPGGETPPEQIKVPVEEVDPPAGSVRITFAGGGEQSVPETTYNVTVTTGFPGDGTLVLTASQGENQNIALSAEGDTDSAKTTVTKDFTAQTQPTFAVTVSGVEVGDFAIQAAFTLAGESEANTTVSQTLSVVHTLDVTPASTSIPAGVTDPITLTADASYSDAAITWTSSGDSIGALESNVFTPNGTATGTVTVTATYSYLPYGAEAGEEVTVSDTATISVNERAAAPVTDGLIAFADFDYDSGSSVYLQTGENANVSAAYSTNSTQSGTAHSGNAFKVTGDSNNSDTDEYITFTFGSGWSLQDTDTLAISFWSRNNVNSSDWSTIAQASNGSGAGGRIQFMNISVDISGTAGNRWPWNGESGVGVYSNGGAYTSLVDNTAAWGYITVLIGSNTIRYYENGVLLCTYTASAADPVGNVLDSFIYQINNQGSIRFFGNNEGAGDFYIDDLLICTGIDDDEAVSALYNTVSGTNA